jgi:glyoxylase-like metal-dependent hydrolase (beta-lactamase superfamily II)
MTVFFRTTGTLRGPEFFLRQRRRGRGFVRLPVTVAIIERPDGVTLIDTGWSRRTCAFPGEVPGRLSALALGLDVHPEDALASQLLGVGIAPGDVQHVVATHLHMDHIGGIVDFPNATLHTGQAEWACVGYGRLRGYDPTLRALAERTCIHTLAGPPALGFPASHDVSGDGSLLLLDASGHTRGSVAVAVRLEDGWLVHAGDAAMFTEDYRTAGDPRPSLYARVMAQDLGAQTTSWRSLYSAEHAHGARVVPSHDLAVFDTLPHTRDDGWKTVWDHKPKAPQAERKPRGAQGEGSSRADRKPKARDKA